MFAGIISLTLIRLSWFRKISAGEIAIPLVRIETSQKCAKGIHLTDLAKYLDARVEAARKEMLALTT